MTHALTGTSIVFLIVLLGCSDAKQSQSSLRTVQMKLGSRSFTLEVADTEATREHGLMKRDSVPEDHGMIFVFDADEPRDFWMKNTRIPLDIAYVDSTGRVVSVHQMKPYDLSATPSAAPAKYAIELNLGMLEKSGVKPGDRLDIPPEARDPKP